MQSANFFLVRTLNNVIQDVTKTDMIFIHTKLKWLRLILIMVGNTS